MLRSIWQGWRKDKSKAAKPGRKFRPALDALEDRLVPSFAAPVAYNIGTAPDPFVPNAAPIGVVTADFNGDGKLDLAAMQQSQQAVYILLGNGNGTFQPANRIDVGQPITIGMYVADFNGDAKPDLFLRAGSADQADILLGNGDGTFRPGILSSSFGSGGSRGWAVGDFNGDGKLDIVGTNPNSGGVTVLLGNGNGTFQPGIASPPLFLYSRWVTAGDFNRDGKLDLAVADGAASAGQNTSEMTILWGNGDGTFRLGGHYASPEEGGEFDGNPEGITNGDLNNDGKLDVIEALYDHTVNVYLGNGDGTFHQAVSYSSGEYARAMVITDVNGDGKPDLVVGNIGKSQVNPTAMEIGSVAVMLGNGDGSLQDPIQYAPFAYPGWVAVGDFNGDGAPDIAVTRVYDGHEVDVMLNQPGSTNAPPTVVTEASATPNPVAGMSTNLSVLGADDGGEASLTYTWTASGQPPSPNGPSVPPPAPVTFSANGSNAAKNTTATFTRTGTYIFQVKITDAAGLSIIGLETVTVNEPSGPFGGTPAAVPGRIQAENFDNGGEGIAWHDTDAANQGGQYRQTSVDISATADTGGGFTVGWIKAGEWLNYTINVASNGTYTLAARVANPSAGGTLHMEVDGVNVTGSLSIPNTGGWDTWQTITKSGVQLTAGQHALRVAFDTNSSNGWVGNLNWIEITGGAVSNAPPTVATAAGATANPVTGTTTNLSVLGADDGGEASLTYTWVATGTPPAPVTMSANGTNAAKNTTATFSQAGSYSFQVTIRDAGGLTATSNVNVTVTQTLTTIALTPATATLTSGATQQFSATGKDQFGAPLAVQPAIAWSVEAGGVGTVSNAGLYTAPATGGGSAMVRATSGARSGAAAVTISAASQPVNLSSAFNHVYMVTDGAPFPTTWGWGGFTKYALSANLLGSQVNWNGSTFNLGAANSNDAVSSAGQTLALPAGHFSTLKFLAFGGGNQLNQAFTVTYTDGTTRTYSQSISTWFQPQNYVGEATAVSMAYFNMSTGARSTAPIYTYGYSLALDPAKTVQSITLPNNSNVVLLAITLG